MRIKEIVCNLVNESCGTALLRNLCKKKPWRLRISIFLSICHWRILDIGMFIFFSDYKCVFPGWSVEYL